jgi:adenosine deaminase
MNLAPKVTHNFLRNLPKAELHVHLEGTMQPDLLLKLAERNRIAIPYTTIEEAEHAYIFKDYESFVKAYLVNTQVLQKEQDFYDVMWSYLEQVSQQGVKHIEIFFDLQTYMPRNIHPAVVIEGIHQALQDGEKEFGITGLMIMCFLRNLPEKDAFKALEASLSYREKIVGVGLASSEINNPPQKFELVFKKAREYGYRLTAHAELSGPRAVWDTLTILNVERIDHGTCSYEDRILIQTLKQRQITLTVCPISNLRLGIYSNLQKHPLKKMLAAGLKVTINSDDPAFFQASLLDNFIAASEQLLLSADQLILCARNSFEGSFASATHKQQFLVSLDRYVQEQELR